ncbi:hypothetical protein DV704_07525 [Meiothermus sp. QL-1]|uniref:VLRF1 family aeRF1-type release factor n=1 Tax=Meiothermus sp. QL-1 TaxID=2058095 RepID=UPI000E0C7720|nr:VLRF1 family aeRF1-type release factor [Meiothermus sp. QL-1]RDI95408.1 hypothetical protein DV704_07525 [Meiothermus sp. QL-1]
MLSEEHIGHIRTLAPPLLSLYLSVNPARPENQGRAYLLRAREAMEATGAPPEVRQRVLAALEEPPRAKTRALFATADRLEAYDLQVELPLLEGVEAHWGEPYLTPLLYVLDEYERVGVVFLDSEKWRLFEVYLGEIEEISGAFRAVDPQAWRRLTQDQTGRRYGPGGAQRAAPDTDHLEQRLAVWTQRFYKEAAAQLEQAMRERGLGRLILMGPKAEVSAFEAALPRRLRERVAATLPSLPSPNAQASEVLRAVEEVLEPLERAREVRLLEELVERGVAGLEQTLELLQQGRLHTLVAPWRPAGRVYQAQDGWVALSPEAARAHGEPIRELELKQVLPELTAAYGTRLELVRGPAEERLRQELGGLAGLLRW